ncbi:MAG: ribose-5-phosphate isomerase RpiA [Coriobacteriia bacterium]|nr:ribose-5-phosphate isomerase RpiA [Coriobacteriia bacterium]
MTDPLAMKEAAARAALTRVSPGTVIGVGTGSTAAAFVRALGESRIGLAGAVPSSLAIGRLLAAAGIRVIEPGTVCAVPLYVDGADEADPMLRLIKGGGGALTREKIVASMAERFVCIVDETKLVPTLGAFPLAVEVLPPALGRVECELKAFGGDPVFREGFITDNGNQILDVRRLDFALPEELEVALDGIAGVVAHGLFARRPADVLIVGLQSGGTREITPIS